MDEGHTVFRDGVTYYMNDEEYEHADEWVAAIEESIKENSERWAARKEALYEKWRREKEQLPFE